MRAEVARLSGGSIMRFVVSVAGISVAVALGYVAYSTRPIPRQTSVYYTAHEQRTETAAYEFTLDGKKGVIHIPREYTVARTLPRTEFIEPTWQEKLRFWVMLIFASLMAAFYSAVMVLWVWRQARGRSPSKGVEIQLATALAFGGGILTGILLAPSQAGPDLDSSPVEIRPTLAPQRAPTKQDLDSPTVKREDSKRLDRIDFDAWSDRESFSVKPDLTPIPKHQ